MRILFKFTGINAVMGILFYLATGTINAQQSTDFIPRSPEASMLRQYGNGHNVNAMGLASIDIPLHEISIDGLTIPISINYVSDGIRVNDRDISPVGLKWVLNYGGMVSRSIVGLPDDSPQKGWCTPSNTTDFSALPTKDNCYVLYQSVYKSTLDYAADEFAYSFLDYNGNFFFERSSWNILDASKSPLGISKLNGSLNQIGGFSFFDPKGNTFKFTEAERMDCDIETYANNSASLSSSPSGSNGWKLKQITTIKNDTISYEYEDYHFKPDKFLKSVTKAQKVDGSTIDTRSYQQDEFFLKLVKEIKTPYEKISFTYTDKPRIDSIIIESLVNDIYKTRKIIKFYYIKNNKSKQLKAITIYGEKGKSNPDSIHYNFDYDTRFIPEVGSTRQDLFGYINGNTSSLMIPRIGGTTFANREVDPFLITTGMLKRITYPTGGFSEFEFEANADGVASGVLRYGPGVRVSRITDFNADSTVVSSKRYIYYSPIFFPFAHYPGDFRYHTYLYTLGDFCDLSLHPNPDHENPNSDPEPEWSWVPWGSIVDKDKRIWSSDPILKKINFGSSIIQESDPNDSNPYVEQETHLLQKFRANFTRSGIYNKELRCTYYKNVTTVTEGGGKIQDGYFFYSDGLGVRPFNSGKAIIDEDGTTKKSYFKKYEMDSINLLFSYYMPFETFLGPDPYGGGNSGTIYPPLGKFEISVDKLSRTIEKETTFNSDGTCIADSTTTVFNEVGLPKKVTSERIGQIGESNDEYIKEIRYSDEDYSPEAKSSSIVFPSQTSMLLNVPIEENTYLKRAGQDTLLTGSKVTLYDLVPTEVYKLNIQNPVNPNAYRTYNREVKLHYNDKKRVEQIDLPDKTEVLYWSSNGQYPLAKLDNTFADNVKNNALLKSKLDELFLYSKIDSPEKISALNALNSSIRQLIPQNVFITTYTYDHGVGVTSITDPNGVTTFYDYDSQGRLKIAKDFNGNTLKQYDYHYNGQAVMDELFSALVTFDSQGGSSLIPFRVPKRTKITTPTNPIKYGYTFLGWFKEPNCINPWNYSVDSVMSDVTLYAKWVINSYTINSLVVGSGGTVSPSGSTSVTDGSSINYTFNPSIGYHVKNVKVNGSSVGNMNSYIFANVTSNQTIEVVFEACILNTNTTSISFTSSGGTKSFSITSNTNWNIINNLSWLTITPSLGNGSITVTVNASKTISDRFGNITISGDGITKTIIVSQEGVLIPLEP